MDKTEAIAAIIRTTPTTPIVFTTGYACRIANGIADRPNHFYMTGSMGLAANIGTGIAQMLGQTVVVVDGDGSLAMNPSCLLAAGALQGLPLLHIVLDDGAYASTGGQASPTSHIDFGALAESCGYAATYRVASAGDLTRHVSNAVISGCRAPTLLHCVVVADSAGPPPRIEADLADHAQRFGRHLRTLASTNH
jgi:sulfopyruvate decarboxylase subunit beta